MNRIILVLLLFVLPILAVNCVFDDGSLDRRFCHECSECDNGDCSECGPCQDTSCPDIEEDLVLEDGNEPDLVSDTEDAFEEEPDLAVDTLPDLNPDVIVDIENEPDTNTDVESDLIEDPDMFVDLGDEPDIVVDVDLDISEEPDAIPDLTTDLIPDALTDTSYPVPDCYTDSWEDHFYLLCDNTVYDHETGLTWARASSRKIWTDAIAWCDDLEGQWSLPEIGELMSIEGDCTELLNLVWPGVGCLAFWSVTEDMPEGTAVTFDFASRETDNADQASYQRIRCVNRE